MAHSLSNPGNYVNILEVLLLCLNYGTSLG